jgi:hypothetical protein
LGKLSSFGGSNETRCFGDRLSKSYQLIRDYPIITNYYLLSPLGQKKNLLLMKRDYHFLLRLKGNVVTLKKHKEKILLRELDVSLRMPVNKVVSDLSPNLHHFKILSVQLAMLVLTLKFAAVSLLFLHNKQNDNYSH